MKNAAKFSAYAHPAGGWGSVQSLGRSLAREHVPLNGARVLTHQNKPDGYACRHNALDKLAGALARSGIAADRGFVVLSSRVSIEMVQKAAVMGASIIVALSVPTTLAVRACDTAGLTLVAIAREDSFEVFTHPERIRGDSSWRAPHPGAVREAHLSMS